MNILASGNRILSVKSSNDGIGWNEQYRERSEEFVNTIHATTTHAYSLCKFIFLCAIQDGASFDIASYINKEFFSEELLSLVNYRRGCVDVATAWKRALISQYIKRYLDCTSYIRPGLKYAQQSSGIKNLRNNPEVICHGLLRCTNQNWKVTVQNISGVEELRERLWNRDLAACLNMIRIVRKLRLNDGIPERLQRARAERRGPTGRRTEENEE
ncbi:hypothetical protein G6F46_003649 [Rhizopus delemar]|nr:hypothetical protein G6F55_002275 [Rhizopus delemar]KAG1548120.1 hypothetical protein G6F51_003850 [Rhizopus arrhizus]KAG1502075.1 hypothetical protein G6F54_002613 [Rhizopus delemar]KAG1515012.1 hypothetical protein G6F53_003249 [Rhizopus delemar]KAG1519921.1 hypothetical protein G6F52_008155 [Rhizopus delemar]